MYKEVGLTGYLLAGVVVSIPAVILTETNPGYAWSYVVLILLALMVFYSPQVKQFTTFAISQY